MLRCEIIDTSIYYMLFLKNTVTYNLILFCEEIYLKDVNQHSFKDLT